MVPHIMLARNKSAPCSHPRTGPRRTALHRVQDQASGVAAYFPLDAHDRRSAADILRPADKLNFHTAGWPELMLGDGALLRGIGKQSGARWGRGQGTIYREDGKTKPLKTFEKPAAPPPADVYPWARTRRTLDFQIRQQNSENSARFSTQSRTTTGIKTSNTFENSEYYSIYPVLVTTSNHRVSHLSSTAH